MNGMPVMASRSYERVKELNTADKNIYLERIGL